MIYLSTVFLLDATLLSYLPDEYTLTLSWLHFVLSAVGHFHRDMGINTV